jgi:hypothetical protein
LHSEKAEKSKARFWSAILKEQLHFPKPTAKAAYPSSVLDIMPTSLPGLQRSGRFLILSCATL